MYSVDVSPKKTDKLKCRLQWDILEMDYECKLKL